MVGPGLLAYVLVSKFTPARACKHALPGNGPPSALSPERAIRRMGANIPASTAAGGGLLVLGRPPRANIRSATWPGSAASCKRMPVPASRRFKHLTLPSPASTRPRVGPICAATSSTSTPPPNPRSPARRWTGSASFMTSSVKSTVNPAMADGTSARQKPAPKWKPSRHG